MIRIGLIMLCLLLAGPGRAETLTVGSKMFAESHVLAELVALSLEEAGYTVERKLSLGGTMVVWEALKKGELDIYPEYSGTLSQTILRRPGASLEELQPALASQGLEILLGFGFNNSYAIAVHGPLAREHELLRVSQLRDMPELKLGFSLEFINRADGWPALSEHYQLPHEVSGLEHALAYRAIASRQLDVTDAFTTDGELQVYDLVLLEDDLQFFPRYDGILMVRAELPEQARRALAGLEQRLDDATMQSLNAAASEPGVSPRRVAADFLGLALEESTLMQGILRNTGVHLKLTGIALLLACLVAVPLALALSRQPRASSAVLYITGLMQTIPSLALLAMLIPILGLGQVPAIVALFLYSLLPIVRNTLTGITTIDPLLREVAEGMGMTARERLRHVEIPLALPTILAGIKTAAIISIGTATLAAFVGAGGLGEPIVTGLNLNDHNLILQGAIPAAVLAIVTEFLFEWLERSLTPPHLAAQQ